MTNSKMKTKAVIVFLAVVAAFTSCFASGSRLHELADMLNECEVVNVDDPKVTKIEGFYVAYQLCNEDGVPVSKYIEVRKTEKTFHRFVW